MPAFNGQLRPNEIYASIYNMILSQEVFSDNIYDTKASLVDQARVDGGLYGDTKLYYSTDVLRSRPWLNDSEAANLLNLYRPKDPEVQAIVLDQFRQICLTVDNYLSKRAWGDEYAFQQFNSVMLGWIRDTKRVYDSTLYNSYIGTAETGIGEQSITIILPIVKGDAEATSKEQGAAIAKRMSDLLVDLEDVTRNYNDYGHLRSYNSNDLIAVWNSEQVNKINKYTLPVLYHKENFIDKLGEYTLPARYFGTPNTEAGTTPSTNLSIRSLIETDYTVSGETTHVFPGELLPGDASYEADVTYTEDSTILFKLMHKKSVPYMSAFEVATDFFNPKSLTETHYLTFGYNTIEYLKNYPYITVRGVNAEAGSAVANRSVKATKASK